MEISRHPSRVREEGAARRDPAPGCCGAGRASRVGSRPGSAASHRGGDGSRVDRAPRHRCGHRSSSHRVVLPRRTLPKRRRVRCAVGHQSTAGQQRQDGSASAQPRRRPSPERAIQTIAMTRMRCCPTTKNYVARCTAAASPAVRSGDASSATPPASSTAPSTPAPRSPIRHRRLGRPLDKHRSVRSLGFESLGCATVSPSRRLFAG